MGHARVGQAHHDLRRDRPDGALWSNFGETLEIAKILVFGGGGFTKFEGTIQVIDNESSAVLYAYNVKKGDTAAEAFAKHFTNDYLNKR